MTDSLHNDIYKITYDFIYPNMGNEKTWNTYAVDKFNMFKKSTVLGSSFRHSLNAFDVHSHQIAVTGCVSLWADLIPY